MTQQHVDSIGLIESFELKLDDEIDIVIKRNGESPILIFKTKKDKLQLTYEQFEGVKNLHKSLVYSHEHVDYILESSNILSHIMYDFANNLSLKVCKINGETVYVFSDTSNKVTLTCSQFNQLFEFRSLDSLNLCFDLVCPALHK